MFDKRKNDCYTKAHKTKESVVKSIHSRLLFFISQSAECTLWEYQTKESFAEKVFRQMTLLIIFYRELKL